MIKEAIEKLLSVKEGAIHTLPDGRTFAEEHGKFREIMPAQEVSSFFAFGNEPVRVNTVASLCDMMAAAAAFKEVPTDEPLFRVTIDKSDATALYWPSMRYRKDLPDTSRMIKLRLEFLKGIPTFEMDYDQFIGLLDYHTGMISGEAAWREGIAVLKIRSVHELTIKDVGGFTQIAESASKGVEGSSKKLPTKMVIDMEFGTREFIYPTEFGLRIKVEQGQPKFILSLRPDRHLSAKFFSDVSVMIRNTLPELADRIIVLEGS